MDLDARLLSSVPAGRVRKHAPLAPFTTFRVGGPADWLVDVRTIDELHCVLQAGRDFGVAVTLLGGGSNVVVADRGVRGIVVRLRLMEITRQPPNLVRADAGVTMNGLVRWTIGRGLAGLEAWAGTPGTVGGAIHGNAHFGGQNIGDLLARAGVVTRDGRFFDLDQRGMAFAYDASRLQRTREILVWAEFRVSAGDPAHLRRIARQSLAHRKATQPLDMPSAGCVFQNPTIAEVPAGVPASAGALVDRAGLKGRRIGGASISTVHANFFVNDAGATAKDIRALIDLAKTTVREQCGVALREEVVYLGEF